MLYFRRSRFVRFVILPLALMALLPACYKWSTMHGPPDQAITSRPDRVRVTVVEGNQIEIGHPWIQADSIVGLSSSDTLAVAMSDVTKLEKRQFDFLGLAMGYVLVSGVVYLLDCVGDNQDWGC